MSEREQSLRDVAEALPALKKLGGGEINSVSHRNGRHGGLSGCQKFRRTKYVLICVGLGHLITILPSWVCHP